jgi:hypothetical protein
MFSQKETLTNAAQATTHELYGHMKQIKILTIKVMLIFIPFCSSIAVVAAINKCDSLQLPACSLNGKYHILHSSQNGYYIDVVLSKYVEQNLPIMRYDSSSFRFLIFIKIDKKGKVKRIRLINQNSFKNNMTAWIEVQKILKRIHFIPARLNGRTIVYRSTFYLRLDFTKCGN